MKAQDQLNKYSEILEGIQVLQNEMQDLIDTVIPQELKDQISDIKEEYALKMGPLQLQSEKLNTLVKEFVLSTGTTLNGNLHQAIFTKPRVTWDSKGLAGYSVAHPEVIVFQKVGEPSVSFRAKKQ